MLKLVLQKTLEFLASMCSGDRDFWQEIIRVTLLLFQLSVGLSKPQ